MAQEANFMPCKIQHTGSAPVSVYFKSTTIVDKDGKHSTATFRGKLLNGHHVDFLPPDYSLFLVETALKNSAPEEAKTNNAEQTCKILGPVENFVYWNYDCLPSTKDSVAKAINWLKIAEKFSKNDI